MTTLPMPILCQACVRLTNPERGRCEAFPEGIPEPIFKEGGDHREPVWGDRGLQFKLAPGERKALNRWEQFNDLRTYNPVAEAGLLR